MISAQRTTLNLDAKLLAQAQKATGISEKTALIHHGLKALVTQAARERLAALGGAIKAAKAAKRRRQ